MEGWDEGRFVSWTGSEIGLISGIGVSAFSFERLFGGIRGLLGEACGDSLGEGDPPVKLMGRLSEDFSAGELVEDEDFDSSFDVSLERSLDKAGDGSDSTFVGTSFGVLESLFEESETSDR